MNEVIYFDIDDAGLLYTGKTQNDNVRRLVPPGEGVWSIGREILEFAGKGKIVTQGEGYIIRPADRTKRAEVNAMLPSHLRAHTESLIGYFELHASGIQISMDRRGRDAGILPAGDTWHGIQQSTLTEAVSGKVVSVRGGYEIRPADRSKRAEINAQLPPEVRPKIAKPQELHLF